MNRAADNQSLTSADGYSPEKCDAICLSLVRGVGPRHFRSLIDCFGSASAVLDAPLSQLRQVPGIGPSLASRIAEARMACDVQAELARCCALGVRIVGQEEPEYPAALRNIPTPPCMLYQRGAIEPRDSVAIAIVGSRGCTRYGLKQTERLARSLAQAGFTVISGLARGIDIAAHRSALAAGGRTIAVLASGLGTIYPPDHAEFAGQLCESGALLSEMPTLYRPIGSLFPQRNRIISGLSLGVIVVEAATRSGALITARHAMDQNREVFAVPGPVDSPLSQGCHRLLRDGARLVESVDDVLESLGPLAEAIVQPAAESIRHPIELTLNEQETVILRTLADRPASIDEIVARIALPTPQVLATLSVLEMRRLVRRLPGNRFVRI